MSLPGHFVLHFRFGSADTGYVRHLRARKAPAVRPPLNKILYVDDERDVRLVAEISLTRIGGYEVQVAESGTDALEQLREFDADLVLLDVVMPGMDGPTTLHQMRLDPATARLPVAFVTARHQPYDLQRYRLLGIAGVIAKPFDPMSLPSQVLNIWDGVSRPAAG